MSYYQLFRSGTSFNPNYEKESIDFKRNDNLFIAMRNSLYNKYSYSQNFFYIKNIKQIATEESSIYVKHKDQQIFDEEIEYLTKYLKFEVCQEVMQEIVKYYKYHSDWPRFFLEPQSLDYILDKYIRKRKQLEYEETLKKISKEKKKQEKQNTQFKLDFKKIIQQKYKNINYIPILKDINLSFHKETKQNSGNTTMKLIELIGKETKVNTYNLKKDLDKHLINRLLQERHNIHFFNLNLSHKKSNRNIFLKFSGFSTIHNQGIAQMNQENDKRITYFSPRVETKQQQNQLVETKTSRILIQKQANKENNICKKKIDENRREKIIFQKKKISKQIDNNEIEKMNNANVLYEIEINKMRQNITRQSCQDVMKFLPNQILPRTITPINANNRNLVNKISKPKVEVKEIIQKAISLYLKKNQKNPLKKIDQKK